MAGIQHDSIDGSIHWSLNQEIRTAAAHFVTDPLSQVFFDKKARNHQTPLVVNSGVMHVEIGIVNVVVGSILQEDKLLPIDMQEDPVIAGFMLDDGFEDGTQIVQLHIFDPIDGAGGKRVICSSPNPDADISKKKSTAEYNEQQYQYKLISLRLFSDNHKQYL